MALQRSCRWDATGIAQQKARALVFYLGATGRAHAREHLATLLWSESDAPGAHHSLRSTLYLIRRALQAHGAAVPLSLIECLCASISRRYRAISFATMSSRQRTLKAPLLKPYRFAMAHSFRDSPYATRLNSIAGSDAAAMTSWPPAAPRLNGSLTLQCSGSQQRRHALSSSC